MPEDTEEQKQAKAKELAKKMASLVNEIKAASKNAAAEADKVDGESAKKK